MGQQLSMTSWLMVDSKISDRMRGAGYERSLEKGACGLILSTEGMFNSLGSEVWVLDSSFGIGHPAAPFHVETRVPLFSRGKSGPRPQGAAKV